MTLILSLAIIVFAALSHLIWAAGGRLGYSVAQHRAVAEAHMKLSSLHMGRIKQLDESCGGSGPSFRW